MPLNTLSSRNQAFISLTNADAVIKSGTHLQGTVHIKIASTIKHRGIFVVLRGWERCCWKNTVVANKTNSNATELVFQEVMIAGNTNILDSLSVGEHSFSLNDFYVPENLPSSFSLKQQNKLTGVFYTLQVELRTVTGLKSSPLPLSIEGHINTIPLLHDVKVNRKKCKSLIKGGQITMSITLCRSILVAGDELPIYIEIDNRGTTAVDYFEVELVQQLDLLWKPPKKKFTVQETVSQLRIDTSSDAVPDKSERIIRLKVPEDLPSTQNTPHGVVTIEYHIAVRLHVPWDRDLRLRAPVLVLEASRCEESDDDVSRREKAKEQGEINAKNFQMNIDVNANKSDSSQTIENKKPTDDSYGRVDSGAPPAPINVVSGDAQVATAIKQETYGSVPGRKRPTLRKTDNYHLDAETIKNYSTLRHGHLKSDEEIEEEERAALQAENESNNNDDNVEKVLEIASAEYGYQDAESVQKLKNCCEYFAKFDSNNNLVLEKDEFTELHKDLTSNNITQLPLEDSWNELDADESGDISINEFVDWLVRIGTLPAPDQTDSHEVGGLKLAKYPYRLTKTESERFGPAALSRFSTKVALELEEKN